MFEMKTTMTFDRSDLSRARIALEELVMAYGVVELTVSASPRKPLNGHSPNPFGTPRFSLSSKPKGDESKTRKGLPRKTATTRAPKITEEGFIKILSSAGIDNPYGYSATSIDRIMKAKTWAKFCKEKDEYRRAVKSRKGGDY